MQAKHITHANPPDKCDICKSPVEFEFFDAKTADGPWANVCRSCMRRYGVGIGLGMGQHYRKDYNGDYVKVEG